MVIHAPAVSVIIPCFRADAFLGLQLQALANQVNPGPFEVLLVDNGENADLQGFVESFPRLDLRVIDARAEAGTAYARNMGISRSCGDLLLFCDADDVVGSTWVRDGAQQLRQWPAFSGGAVPFDAELFREDLAFVWDELNQHIDPALHPLPPFGVGDYPILLGCSFGMTKKLALELGGFDRTFGAQAEDNDLAFRLQAKLGFVPAARHIAVAYRLRAADEMTFLRGYEAGFKHAMMCARHRSWAVSPSYQGHWVARAIKETAVAALRGQLARDPLGRQLGIAVGYLYFARKRALPGVRGGTSARGEWDDVPTASCQCFLIAA